MKLNSGVPVFLYFPRFYFCYRKAREDEAAATRRLNEMEANYGDVIPRRDFEALQKQYQVRY